MPRQRRGSEIKARITPDLKLKVRALAAMRADDENESLVLREALVHWVQKPEVKEQIQLGLKRLQARGEISEIPALDE